MPLKRPDGEWTPNEELFDLNGRVVLITGAAGLLGPEYVRGLSEAGADVVITDVGERLEECEALAEEMRDKYDVSPMAARLDLFEEESVRSAIHDAVEGFGKLDVLVNNAAYNPLSEETQAPFEEYRLDVWKRVLDVNLTGVFLCCREAGRVMVEQGHGNIINIGSVYGMVGADQRIYGESGLNSSPVYAASKGGVINLTRYLAAYWEGQNIRVNSLSPGGVFAHQSEEFLENYRYRTMLGRMAMPQDLRGAILYLASDASSFMTGSNLVVDAGWTAW